MRIISKSTLKKFWLIHPDSEQQLKAWHKDVSKADWESPHDVKQEYSSADIIGKNRVVFNIKGNRYRLVVKIYYTRKLCYIRFVGTHDEYNNIDSHSI